MIALDADQGDTLRPAARGAPRVQVSERMVVLSVAVLVAIVAVLTVTPWPVGAFQDDAMYTVLAKSLAEGHGYRFLNLPGEPNATHFPPGYPLVLALLWKVAPPFRTTSSSSSSPTPCFWRSPLWGATDLSAAGSRPGWLRPLRLQSAAPWRSRCS